MTSIRPFSCDLCPQTFTRNENLERHRRSRHGDDSRRPFECLHCQTRFSRRDVCKRHTKRCQGRAGRPPTSGDGDADAGASQPTPPVPSFSPIAVADTAGSGHDQAVVDGQTQLFAMTGLSPAEPTNTLLSSQETARTHISAYFDHFHPSFPLLHRPTVGDETPQILRNIIIAIGALYAAQTFSDEDAAVCIQSSQEIWDSGRKELSRLVSVDWRELRRTWIMQAWLLHIIYGAYMGGAARYGKAKTMLRSLVDAAQDLGLLRQTVATSASRPWASTDIRASLANDAQALHNSWILYVNEESMKLSVYALIFLDFHILSPCNLRPLVSPMELDWELPLPRSLWESDTAQTWLETLEGQSSVSFMLELDDSLGFPCPVSRSLSLATQSLMSEITSPYLLSALTASPMATLFVITNIDAFVRDLTRCCYQFPPGLADPSAFHIFTQSQNRQVNAALRHISDVIKERDTLLDGLDGSIWSTIERMVLSIKIALYKPDDLLIGGIVDSTVVAGLATATHMTLGLYSGARRGQLALPGSSSGDDAILVILDEAMDVLLSIYNGDSQAALLEAPWATVTTYRILLAIWRSLRWAARELRTRSLPEGRMHRRYEAPAVIFNAVMEVVQSQQEQQDDYHDAFSLFPSPDEGEERFTRTVLRFWKERNAWALGSSMATVLEEAISAGY
ncbi:hypothetical protein B0T10DRAFT_492986 [Thelonectria olida]|uniref:C2H2-type domain-containing protein n=1 Tax=Thelonectria olida TaxID=1576542 RepID=A0A9P8VY60_9HYPO|nr:hypothetical protein B0T10DRAFT_492986 [Thelonectria olida]